MDRDGYAKLGTRSMEEPRMTSSLVVNVEACTQKGSYNLLGSYSRNFRRHAVRGYGMVTATRSVVISATSPGIGSPVSRALSK